MLMFSAVNGWYEGAQTLLSQGADVNLTIEVRMCELIDFRGEYVDMG